MLEQEVSIGLLIVWVGIALGLGLLVLSDVVGVASVGWWGIAVLVLACTQSVHRALAVSEDRLRDVFQLGRDHERTPRPVR